MIQIRSTRSHQGFSLLEIIAALTITAMVAVIGIRHLRVPSETAHQRTCDMTRQTLQGYVEQYRDDTGQLPQRDLREIRTANYAGTTLPTCPITRQGYSLVRGVVGCPTHEATR